MKINGFLFKDFHEWDNFICFLVPNIYFVRELDFEKGKSVADYIIGIGWLCWGLELHWRKWVWKIN